MLLSWACSQPGLARGAAVALPLLVIWLSGIRWHQPLKAQLDWKWLAQDLFALLPLVGYVIWRFSPLGEGWAELQSFYFGRGLMDIGRSIDDWQRAIFYGLYQGNKEKERTFL